MRYIFLLSHILLLPLSMDAQRAFKCIVWYEEWCQRPLGTSGYGMPAWQYSRWSDIDVIVHFDNDNVNDNAVPYWCYVNRGNAFSDSVGFFGGTDGKAYVDSLITIGHRNGCAVVMSITQPNPTHLNNLIGDSAKIETLCAAIAQFCQRYGYDGVDLNYEMTPSTQANVSRLLRRLRFNLNRYITRYQKSLPRPWLSVTSPWEWAGGIYLASEQDLVDMYCFQQGTLESVWNGTCRANINWYGAALKLGRSNYASAKSRDLWIATFQDDASWIPYTHKPRGIRKAVALGFSKSKIAPAFSLGGGSVNRGTDTLYGCISGALAQNRNQLKALLANGGGRHWDAEHQAEYINGTATAAACGVSSGQKFFAPIPDSTQAYYATDWLIKNGYGGIAPYSVAFDVDVSFPISRRLPGHSGIFSAKNNNKSILLSK